jgi:hypothetical protein
MAGSVGLVHGDSLSLVLPKDSPGAPSILNRPQIGALTARATNAAIKAGSPRSGGNSSSLLSAASTARRGSTLSSSSAPSTPHGAEVQSRAILAVEKEAVTAWNEQNLFGQDDFGATPRAVGADPRSAAAPPRSRPAPRDSRPRRSRSRPPGPARGNDDERRPM